MGLGNLGSILIGKLKNSLRTKTLQNILPILPIASKPNVYGSFVGVGPRRSAFPMVPKRSGLHLDSKIRHLRGEIAVSV
jgi:hypothetical protein